MNVLGMNCPHCKTWSTVRSSEPLSPLVRAVFFQCRQLHCGHTWKAHLEAVHTITPSAVPDPNIDLPLSSRSEHLRRIAETRAAQRPPSFDHDHETDSLTRTRRRHLEAHMPCAPSTHLPPRAA